MKNLTLLTGLIFTLLSTTMIAQAKKGNFLTGISSSLNVFSTQGTSGTLGVTSIRYKSDNVNFEEPAAEKTSGVNFSPFVGYFPISNLAIGLNLGYSSSKNEEEMDELSIQTVYFGGGPVIRYYKRLDEVLVFFEVNGAYGQYNTSFQVLGEDENVVVNAKSYGGGMGLAIPLGEIVTFDILARYNSLTLTETEDNPDNIRALANYYGLDLGFTVFLGKKSKDKE